MLVMAVVTPGSFVANFRANAANDGACSGTYFASASTLSRYTDRGTTVSK